jgi:thioredoxin 1
VIEIGASWCGICAAFTPQARAVFADYPLVRPIRVEDGPGKRLGRSFRVKLWPTFVFLRDGHLERQLARPGASEVRAGLEAITANS